MNRFDAKAAVAIRDGPGMMTDIDPHDRPDGSSVIQVNAIATDAGLVVQSRSGYLFVKFESTTNL